MAKRMLLPLTKGRLPANVGSKARNLRRLAEKGFRIPQTWVCTWEAHERYLQHDPGLRAELSSQLADILNDQQAYAIRSSANVEDLLAHSFAGQFQSFLDVCGLEAVLEAMESIWKSAQSEAVRAYQEKQSLAAGSVRMGVLVQEMIAPQLSGVAFSKNPMTATDETLVEAVRGPGTLLVQEGVTPLRWVNKWGTWLQSEPDAGVEQEIIAAIVQQTRAISQEMDNDVDLEWVYDGSQLYWVQMRDITSVGNLNIYSNRIAREMLPGQIKPLIWSINTRLINQVWVKLFNEAIGRTGLDPDSLTKAFYYRTYFNMGAFGRVFKSMGLPRESLEIMMGIVPAEVRKPRFRPPPRLMLKSPRLAKFMLAKIRFAKRIDPFLQHANRELQTIPLRGLEGLPAERLLEQIDRIFALTSQVAYFNIVGPLLNFLYHSLLIRQLKGQKVDYNQLDLVSEVAELKEYDPNHHLAALHAQYRQLSEPLQVQVQQSGSNGGGLPDAPEFAAFRSQVDQFISRFGHFSDSGNDFSSVPWRERPEIILGLVAHYQPVSQETANRKKFDELGIGGPRGWFLRVLHRRARQFSLYREQISSLYTYSYGLFRPYYLALAHQLVQQGSLGSPDDIFYMYASEVRALLADASRAGSLAAQVEARKQEMLDSEDIPLPELIYGDQAPPIRPKSSRTLVGTATSRGYYSGPVKVIRGLSEFAKMQPGDVLVVPFSDVGWTPLFVKAGAVIADSGGMLSHSSIIAREYNIPAVVSVPGVLKLADGTRVSVDGFKGEVLVHDDPAGESPPAE